MRPEKCDRNFSTQNIFQPKKTEQEQKQRKDKETTRDNPKVRDYDTFFVRKVYTGK